MHDHVLVTQDGGLNAQLDRALDSSIGATETLRLWLEARGKRLEVAYCERCAFSSPTEPACTDRPTRRSGCGPGSPR